MKPVRPLDSLSPHLLPSSRPPKLPSPPISSRFLHLHQNAATTTTQNRRHHYLNKIAAVAWLPLLSGNPIQSKINAGDNQQRRKESRPCQPDWSGQGRHAKYETLHLRPPPLTSNRCRSTMTPATPITPSIFAPPPSIPTSPAPEFIKRRHILIIGVRSTVGAKYELML
ncbi:hypothetical protein Tsubulata_050125 [Turnera subulata]|uniref:Uncharacterized protein n=1 Tax=Turnera subulata TaxID=218843 RepID=A0A9Q0J2B1_9ROSI|nr:hypothetical protein Tsubulata_050125 [Turnera subulata]